MPSQRKRTYPFHHRAVIRPSARVIPRLRETDARANPNEFRIGNAVLGRSFEAETIAALLIARRFCTLQCLVRNRT